MTAVPPPSVCSSVQRPACHAHGHKPLARCCRVRHLMKLCTALRPECIYTGSSMKYNQIQYEMRLRLRLGVDSCAGAETVTAAGTGTAAPTGGNGPGTTESATGTAAPGEATTDGGRSAQTGADPDTAPSGAAPSRGPKAGGTEEEVSPKHRASPRDTPPPCATRPCAPARGMHRRLP